MSGLRAIRARALRVLPLAVAGVAALAAGAALGASPEARTTASAYAVLINVPGAQSSGTLTSPAGSYQYRDLVAIHSYTAGSALSGERAYGHSDLSGITLLGGVVTADSILSRTYADGRKVPATGSFGGTVSGLVVAGAAVSVQPGGQFPIPGIGWGAVDERRVVRSDGAYRGSEVALHIRLSSDWHNLPAGTEILLGYSDAAARAQAAADAPAGKADATPATGAQSLARGGESDTNPGLFGAPVVPVPASDGTPTDSGDGVTPTGIEAPPPGGFTLTPPVSSAIQQQLTSPGYAFPVAGGAHYGHDFGNFRADTGFHEGSDLFAPAGTPLVAVQSGVLHNVGWNRLGGWRLWVEDEHGNWFYYAHLSAYSPIAKNDAHVNAGDVIGFLGSTGDAQGGTPHLHFEIHPGGQWAVPPYDYLQAWQGHRNPLAAIPAVLPQPPVAASELGSTDISAASGLETAAVLAVASGVPVDTGLVALGVPAPTASELLAAAPAP
ncbi:MAG: peptidoglycan LD-endopeptidase LytH [Gaiellales bacterium]|nr:peptidoglycan LD-endopeptidase LytH [Gaiellales bacterium]